jgi:hypothetical protein
VKLGVAIRDVGDAERALVQELNAVGARHAADHDVVHLGETLQRIAHHNLERLAPHGRRYDVEIGSSERAEALAETAATDRPPETGLALVRDLRALHLRYAEASINWVILGQGAHAARDRDLLDTVSHCHAQTLRGMKWAVTRIRSAAPQALIS